jgi:exosortase B
MSSAYPPFGPPVGLSQDARSTWLVVGSALFALLAYSCWQLWHTSWNDEAHAHGPIIAAVIVWLCWRQSVPAIAVSVPAQVQVGGWLLLMLGVVAYGVGHAVVMPLLHVAALIPIAIGVLLVVGGARALTAYWFPVLFLVFLIPFPAFVIEHLTSAMKWRISWLTEMLLYEAGYPIARSGVVLAIGQYQLLVADACSGLNSIFSLFAMGLLYLHLMQHRNRLRSVVLLLLLVPVAVLANLLRVLFLVLLTYHAGDEAAQGFMHDFAGLSVFVIALLLIFGIDGALGRLSATRDARAGS